MKHRRLEDTPPSERKNHIRQGHFQYWQLLEGEDGSANNFSLQFVRLGDDFYSPRHRHNFEQIRIQVEGTFDFGRDGAMSPGTVGYFPEGVPYGPQTVASPGGGVLVLQFAGISGNGYLSEAMQDRGSAELHARGAFRNGAFTRVDADGRRHNQDGFEAVWEHLMGRPISYPDSAYQAPIMLRADDGTPGERILGDFQAADVTIRSVTMAPGATLAVAGPSILVALSGEGRAEGQPWSRLTAMAVEPGETVTVAADADSEMLVIRMPRLTAQPLRATG
jgi:hypothetical protein